MGVADQERLLGGQGENAVGEREAGAGPVAMADGGQPAPAPPQLGDGGMSLARVQAQPEPDPHVADAVAGEPAVRQERPFDDDEYQAGYGDEPDGVHRVHGLAPLARAGGRAGAGSGRAVEVLRRGAGRLDWVACSASTLLATLAHQPGGRAASPARSWRWMPITMTASGPTSMATARAVAVRRMVMPAGCGRRGGRRHRRAGPVGDVPHVTGAS